MKKTLLAIILPILFSCSSNKDSGEITAKTDTDEYTDEQLGEYVYIDMGNCLHIDRHCRNLCNNKSEKGFRINYRVYFVKTKQMAEAPDSYCANCVSDKAYKKLNEIIYENSQGQQTKSDVVVPDSAAVDDYAMTEEN